MFLLPLLLAACGGDAPLTASETRVVKRPPSATPRQTDPLSAPPALPPPTRLACDAPPHWHDAGPKGLRLANFNLGSQGEAECYVTILGGAGGGVEMNVNRWRAQMGLDPATENEIAGLPKIPMLNGEAVLVELTGQYGSSDQIHTTPNAVRQDYALLGAILIRDADAVFVKMTGPAEIVRNERDNFIKFTGSLTMEPSATPAGPSE